MFLVKQAQEHHLNAEVYDVKKVQKRLERSKVSYKEALVGSGMPEMAAVKAGYLGGQVARLCLRNKLPPLNALLVNARTREPGKRYLGYDPRIDLFAVLSFNWTDELTDNLLKAIMEVPVFKHSYWK